MKNSPDEDLSHSMNPAKKPRTTSPQKTETPHTIPNTPSSSGHNTDANANANADADAPAAAVGAQEKSETIAPPFPWATDRRAKVHNLNYLMENKIWIITGKLQCKNCKCNFKRDLDLRMRAKDVCRFIKKEKGSMHDMAPESWMNPVLQRCQWCGKENSVEPLIDGTKKKDINWLFLFLTQLLGCCHYQQLKYFLKHNNITIFQSENKERVLYATYMGLYKQVFPHEQSP